MRSNPNLKHTASRAPALLFNLDSKIKFWLTNSSYKTWLGDKTGNKINHLKMKLPLKMKS